MPSVLIQDQTPRNQYTATNGQTVFVYDFTLFTETDIEVYSRSGADVEPDDFEQELRLNIDYTVDLTSSTITLLSAASTGQIITLVRNMPEERLNLYTNGTPITADALNTDQESQVLMIQQNTMYDTVLAPHYNKSAIIDYTNPLGGDVILPVLQPGQTWVKDPTNNFIDAVNIGSGGGGGDVQMLDPGVTGSTPGSVARWNSSGVLTDSVVNIDDNGNITGAVSADFGDIEIAVFDSKTINSKAGKDLDIRAAAGQTTNVGSSGEQVTLSGLKYPTADGTAGYVITTDGAGNLSFAASGGGAPFASTKYNLVQFSNTTGGLQDSGIDYQAGVLSGMTQVNVGNLQMSGNTIAVGNANGNLNLSPNGTGNIVLDKDAFILSGNALSFQNPANTHTISMRAGALTQSTAYVLPLTDGANGQTLQTNGAGTLSWGEGGGGGGNWVQVGTVTAANSATVDLVGVFSAAYTQYMVVARNVTFQTGSSTFIMRVGTGSTPTWKSGASDYIYSSIGQSSNNVASVQNSTGIDYILLADTVSASTSNPTSLILNVFDPANATYKTPFMGEVNASWNSGNALSVNSHSSAYVVAEAISSIRFLASAGNIVTGVFEVYGFNPNGGGSGGGIAQNVVQHTITAVQNGNATILNSNPASEVTITPSSATSRVRITFTGFVYRGYRYSSVAGTLCFIFLYRNGVLLSNNGRDVGGAGENSDIGFYSFTYIDSPATTLPVTYSVGSKGDFYSSIFNPSDMSIGTYLGPFPTIILEEIGAAP